MKKLWYSMLIMPVLLFMLAGGVSGAEVKDKDVMDVIYKYHEYYSKENIRNLMILFPENSEIIGFGGEKDQKVFSPKELKKGILNDFARIDSMTWNENWHKVMYIASGTVAVVATEDIWKIKWSDGKYDEVLMRITWVLEKRQNKWLIVSLNCSVPSDSSNDTNQNLPVK